MKLRFLALSVLVLPGCIDPGVATILPILEGRHVVVEPKASPSPSGSADCLITVTREAPIFHVAFTSPASAGATVSLVPWVRVEAPIASYFDEPLVSSFKATVDEAARTITVSGQIRRRQANPQAGCAFAAMYAAPRAATLSLPVTLESTGTYEVRIASESFTTELPPTQGATSSYPAAEATGSLRVE